jgi:hypothetical protein
MKAPQKLLLRRPRLRRLTTAVIALLATAGLAVTFAKTYQGLGPPPVMLRNIACT